MRRDRALRLFALVGVAACDVPAPDPPTTSREIVLQAGRDRLVLDEVHFPSFPDALVNCVLYAEHAAGSHVVMTGAMEDKGERPRAVRLPDGDLAWTFRNFVCEEL